MEARIFFVSTKVFMENDGYYTPGMDLMVFVFFFQISFLSFLILRFHELILMYDRG